MSAGSRLRRVRRGASVVAFLALAGCLTSRATTVTGGPPDWSAYGGERTVVVVTEDPDGSERHTRVWLVIFEGVGVIRTGDTRWHANLQRNADLRLVVGPSEHRLRVEPVGEPERIREIDAAFREKYGWQDRVARVLRRPRHYMRLVPRPAR